MACRISIIANQGPNKGKRVTSQLFEQILEVQADPMIAEREYNKIYEDDFIEKFGDWIEDPESVAGRVDVNGEPKALMENDIPMFEDAQGNFFEAFTLPTYEARDDKSLKIKSDNLKISEDGLKLIMDRLSKRMGVGYKIINDASKKWAGKFVAGTAVINLAYARRDTPFHEMAHPFVSSIYKTNKPFFNRLYRELEVSPEGQRIIARTKRLNPNLKGEDLRKEIVTQGLGEYAADRVDSNGKPNRSLVSALRRLFKMFGEKLARVLNIKRIEPQNLKDMTLKEVAAMFALADNEIATEVSDFTKDRKYVAVNGLAAQLVNDGVIYKFGDNFYVQDGGVGAGDSTEQNLSKLRDLENSYPGIVKIKENTTVFNYRAGRYMVEFPKDFDVIELDDNAEYQVVQDLQEEATAPANTIEQLEGVARKEQLSLDPEGNEYRGGSGVYERLTAYGKKITGRNIDVDAAIAAAERMFKYRNKETDTIKINDTDLTYDQTVEHFSKNYNYGRAYGKAVHKILERHITGNPKLDKELEEIKREKPDQEAITSSSLNWVETSADFIIRLSGYENGDTMASELMLHSNILGIATQMDGVIQKQDGRLILVDYKTGKGFMSNTSKILKWATDANVDIPNSRQTSAEIELMLRAMMIKEHSPDAQFKDIIVHHLTKHNIGKAPKPVDVRNILRILDKYYKSEQPEVYEKLKERGLLNYKTYFGQQFVGSDIISRYSETAPKDKLAAMERDLIDVRYKLKNGVFSDSNHKDQLEQERNILQKTILELRSQDKESITSDTEVGFLKRWTSSLWNVDNKKIQAFASMFKQQQKIVRDKVFEERKESYRLFKDVKDEYDKKNPLNKIVESVGGLMSTFDYRELYSFAYTYKDNENYVPGMYFKSREQFEKEYKEGKLTEAQYKLMNHLEKTWNDTYNDTMLRIAYVGDKGNEVSYRQAMQFSKDSPGIFTDGRLDKHFMPRIQKENNEYVEEFHGLDRVTKGGYRRVSTFIKNQLTFFYEEEFSGRTLEGSELQQVRVKHMGSEYSIHTQDHSFNLEQMHNQFYSNMVEKRHMDGVVATGDALTDYYRQKAELQPKGSQERSKFEGLYEFMDKQLVLNVLKEQEFGSGDFSKMKIPIKIRGTMYTFSPYKILMALKNLTTGTSMWLKPLAGTFNGAIVLTFNAARGLGGTLATTAGVPPEQVDFTLGDLAFGYKEVGKYYYDVIRGKKRQNKLFSIAHKYGYLPDNYDYAIDNSDMAALKNPNARYDMMFRFHSIHEEHGHLAILAAQLRRIKMKDGSSLYDSYTNTGDFIGQKGGKQNIRGIRRLPTGEVEIIDELTTEELNRMLKVSTTIHGAYRSDEKSALEAHAFGQFFLQFKKYLPSLLMQEWQSKQDDTFLGNFSMSDANGNMRKEKIKVQRETIDENGNTVKVDQEIDVNVMDWHAAQHRGRAWVMYELLSNPLKAFSKNGTYENFSDREKVAVYGVLSRAIMYSIMTMMVQGMYDDEDFESDATAMRLNYLTKDMLQGFSLSEVARTLRRPFASIERLNNLLDSTTTFMVSGVTGDRTRDGKIKGGKQLQRNLPFLSIKYELDKYGIMQ